MHWPGKMCKSHNQAHRRSFCDELCQLYDVIYKTRCSTLFHTEHDQSSFISNFHIFCHLNENDDGFVDGNFKSAVNISKEFDWLTKH